MIQRKKKTPPPQQSIEQQDVKEAAPVETETKKKQAPWKLKRVLPRTNQEEVSPYLQQRTVVTTKKKPYALKRVFPRSLASRTALLTQEKEEKLSRAIQKKQKAKEKNSITVHCTPSKDLKGILRKGASKKKLKVRWKEEDQTKRL